MKQDTAIKKELFSKADLKRLIIPLVIEQTLALTVGMFDTIMVSSAGESVVSGVSLVDSISILIINLFTALATGGAIVAGQYLGNSDRQNSEKAAKHLVLSVFSLSILVMAVCLLLHRQILSLVFGGVEADVMASARVYFSVVAISYPFMALFNASAALFRGMGNSKNSMVNALIMNVINISGNAIFIYGFEMGALGAALGTLIGRVVAAFSMLFMLRNPQLLISVRSYSPRGLDGGMIKRILKIGIPNGIENSIFQLGKIIVTSLVAGFGTTSIAAHAVSGSLAAAEIIPSAAMGLAITTVVAQCIGANEHEQADYYLKYLLKQAYIWLIALNLVMIMLLRPLLGLYDLSGESFALAYKIMLLHGISSMLIWPLSFTLPNAFRAAGDVKRPMAISVFSMCVFRVGGSYLLTYLFELDVFGVWISMIMDWAFRSICFGWRWKSGKWKRFSAI